MKLNDEIFSFMLSNSIIYDEACTLFELSEEEFDVLLTQDVSMEDLNVKKVKKVLEYLKNKDYEIENRFEVAKIKSAKTINNILKKAD